MPIHESLYHERYDRFREKIQRRGYNPVGGQAMKIGLSDGLEDSARSAPGPLTVAELLARFPEVPPDLRNEPVLAEYVAAFGPLLRLAQKPAPCMARDGGGDAPHHFYTKLVNDLAIYGIGLATRDRTLARLRATLDRHRLAPATFGCSLVPRRAPDAPPAGCRP